MYKTFKIFPDIIDKLENKTKNSKKKSYNFSLNDILDSFYENEVLLYKSYIQYFFDKIFKERLQEGKESKLFVKFVGYVNEIKTNTIIFQRNYFEFLKELSKEERFGNEFERAIYKDISSIFANGGTKDNPEYFDIILERFYVFFNNTLFRNFLVFFCSELYNRYHGNQNVESFILDMLSNNRKIHTVLRFDASIRKKYNIQKHEKKYLFEIKKLNIENINDSFCQLLLESMLKKMNLKGSSLFSNQLRFFGYKRMKFIKNKEMSGDTEILEATVNKKLPEEADVMGQNTSTLYYFSKSKNTIDIISNCEEIFQNETFTMSDVSNNIHQLLRTNFKSDKEKYIQFFEHIKLNNEKLFNKLYFHIGTTIDLFYQV